MSASDKKKKKELFQLDLLPQVYTGQHWAESPASGMVWQLRQSVTNSLKSILDSIGQKSQPQAWFGISGSQWLTPSSLD